MVAAALRLLTAALRRERIRCWIPPGTKTWKACSTTRRRWTPFRVSCSPRSRRCPAGSCRRRRLTSLRSEGRRRRLTSQRSEAGRRRIIRHLDLLRGSGRGASRAVRRSRGRISPIISARGCWRNNRDRERVGWSDDAFSLVKQNFNKN